MKIANHCAVCGTNLEIADTVDGKDLLQIFFAPCQNCEAQRKRGLDKQQPCPDCGGELQMLERCVRCGHMAEVKW